MRVRVLCARVGSMAATDVSTLHNPVTPTTKKIAIQNKLGPRSINTVMRWLEPFWHNNHRFPTDSEFLNNFKLTKDEGTDKVLNFWNKVQNHELFIYACSVRGIKTEAESAILDAEQVAAISLITNLVDNRSNNSKLASIGVTVEQYNGWLQEPEFKKQLQQRIDESLDNIYPDAVNALSKTIRAGNVNAIKFYFELSGRVDTPETRNLKLSVQRLIESVQRHVKDPEVLKAIADEMRVIEDG